MDAAVTSLPDAQHLAAWKTRGPPTAQADEIGLHSGPRPGPMGADHVRVPCVGKLSFSIATPTQPHSRGWRLLPVDNKLGGDVLGGRQKPIRGVLCLLAPPSLQKLLSDRCRGGGVEFCRAAGSGVLGGRQKPARGVLYPLAPNAAAAARRRRPVVGRACGRCCYSQRRRAGGGFTAGAAVAPARNTRWFALVVWLPHSGSSPCAPGAGTRGRERALRRGPARAQGRAGGGEGEGWGERDASERTADAKGGDQSRQRRGDEAVRRQSFPKITVCWGRRTWVPGPRRCFGCS
jgi:hypothetical protein